MELSDEVEINVTPILSGQNLVVMGRNHNIGYITGKDIGEILADSAINMGYEDGDNIPCRIYIKRKKD